ACAPDLSHRASKGNAAPATSILSEARKRLNATSSSPDEGSLTSDFSCAARLSNPASFRESEPAGFDAARINVRDARLPTDSEVASRLLAASLIRSRKSPPSSELRDEAKTASI